MKLFPVSFSTWDIWVLTSVGSANSERKEKSDFSKITFASDNSPVIVNSVAAVALTKKAASGGSA